MIIDSYMQKLIDSTPRQEIKNLSRTESKTKSSFSSLKGRIVCAIAVPKNIAQVVLKPVLYTIFTIITVIAKIIAKLTNAHTANGAFKFLALGAITPLCHALKAAQAAFGILIPGAYFKKPREYFTFSRTSNENHTEEGSPDMASSHFYDQEENETETSLSPRRSVGLEQDVIEDNNCTVVSVSPISDITAPEECSPITVEDITAIEEDVTYNNYREIVREVVNGKEQIRIRCHSKLPQKEPLQVLNEICILLRLHPSLSELKIIYTNERGTDAGGLKRDFVYFLMQAVSQQLRLQDLDLEWSDENNHHLENIGTLFAFMLRNRVEQRFVEEIRKNKLVIGDALHPIHYVGINAFNYTNSNTPFNLLSRKQIVEIASKIYTGEQKTYLENAHLFISGQLTPEAEQNLINYASEIRGYETEESLADFLLNDIQSMCHKRIHAYHAIASQMKATGLQEDELRSILAGNFSKERLLKSLSFMDFEPNEAAFIKNCLAEKTEEELKYFLIFIHGSPVIPADGILLRKGNETRIGTCHKTYLLHIDPKDKDFSRLKFLLDNMCFPIKAHFDYS